MPLPEIVATLLGIGNIVLLVRRSIWNYPFGLAMVTIYAWVFFGAKLYSDALLQIFFFVIQLYGWRAWWKVGGEERPIAVERLGAPGRIAWLAGGAAGVIGWGWFVHRHTDAVFPFWDATVAIYSICAQILLARRYVENWVVWIAVDVTAIGLYATRSLYLTAGLYILFLLFSIVGLVSWARVLRARQSAAA